MHSMDSIGYLVGFRNGQSLLEKARRCSKHKRACRETRCLGMHEFRRWSQHAADMAGQPLGGPTR